MPKLTTRHINILQLVARREIAGVRGKDGWRFIDASEHAGACTAAVMALSAKAFISVTYFENTASVALTQRGRNLLKKETTSCVKPS